ncbi:unnamed protein product [Paramecium primaurelia]|uniref:Uncharacterized protein n=1 Tax=Paramecium primaurelia TaxID=5886 RepID=A0A8S1L5B2_PARPR|nr:unnamed protein product [Paramecium primaurelia]
MSKPSHSPNDLIEFENHNRNSSFGKKLLSTVPNVPAFGFGTSSRHQAQQVYRENRLMEKGKHSPGPIYNPTKNFDQQAVRAPSAGMGTSTRQSLNTNHYDHYKRKDVDFEPQKAENLRKWSAGTVRFGQEQRFLQKELTKTPGPNYDVIQSVQGPKYTMGNRRAHSVSFSTPSKVGPGTYKPKKDFSTELQEPPKYSFTKAPKIPQQKNIDKNQTYYVQESVGAQVASTKPNKPAFSFGKGIREAKLAMYKNDFVKIGVNIKIPHPKF